MFKDLLKTVIDPHTRTWWVALVSSMLIALIYKIAKEKKITFQTFKESTLFHLILHPSSKIDLQLVVARSLIRISILSIFPLTTHYLAIKTILFNYKYYGVSPLSLDHNSLVILYSFTLLIVSDLSRYLMHLCMHKIHFLWRFHQIHHSASVLTPFTLYRVHPIEFGLNVLRESLVFGITAGFFAWLSNAKASIWTLYGVPGFILIFGIIGANLRHSHIRLPYPKWLEYLFISPAQHQIHHSIEHDHQQSNYGSILALWDYLNGSLRFSRETQFDSFGIDQDNLNHNPTQIRSILLDPFKIHISSKKKPRNLK